MKKQKKSEEFAVIGLGRFGSSLARKLEQFGHIVLAIDISMERVQEIAAEVTQAVALDATHEDALQAVDITAFNIVIVAIGEDFETNLIITAILKDLGVPHVISKAQTDRQRNILLRIGADRVLQPEQSGGERLAEELSAPAVLDRVPLGRAHSIAQVRVPASLANLTLQQCDLRNRYGVTVLIVKRDEELIISPPPDTVLLADDALIILGENDRITRFGDLG